MGQETASRASATGRRFRSGLWPEGSSGPERTPTGLNLRCASRLAYMLRTVKRGRRADVTSHPTTTRMGSRTSRQPRVVGRGHEEGSGRTLPFPKPGNRPAPGGNDSPSPVAGSIEQLLWLDGVFYRAAWGMPSVDGRLKTVTTKLSRRM